MGVWGGQGSYSFQGRYQGGNWGWVTGWKEGREREHVTWKFAEEFPGIWLSTSSCVHERKPHRTRKKALENTRLNNSWSQG